MNKKKEVEDSGIMKMQTSICADCQKRQGCPSARAGMRSCPEFKYIPVRGLDQ